MDKIWALIGHEICVTENIECGFFSASAVEKYPEAQ